jgi:phosphoglucosamine mutase
LAKSDSNLNQLKNEMVKYPQVLINVRTNKSIDLDSHQMLNKTVLEVEKSLGDEGRVLIRASGTEPLIRVMVEAKDMKVTQQSAEKLADTLR